MKTRYFALVALLSIGISTSASAQFQVFDQGIINEAAVCASTGNCSMNNVQMNTLESNNYNSEPYSYQREEAERQELEQQYRQERIASDKAWATNHPVKSQAAKATNKAKPTPKHGERVAHPK